MNKKLLLVTDLACHGKVAMTAQIPVLSKMGYDLYNLPTALVSNNFNYKKYEMVAMTDFMRTSIKIWKELNFSFDAISIGFVCSQEQIEIISDLVEYCRKKNPNLLVTLDPIMGDDGSLYHGIGEETVVAMREMCKVADIITPNFTEAVFLADLYRGQPSVSEDEAAKLAEHLSKTFNADFVITSLPVENKKAILTYKDNKATFSFYEEIPTTLYGTGDFFSAYLVGRLLQDVDLLTGAERAGVFIKNLVAKNADMEDKCQGIPIEAYLEKYGLE